MHSKTQYPSVSHSGDMSVRRSRRTTTSTKITTAATMTAGKPVVAHDSLVLICLCRRGGRPSLGKAGGDIVSSSVTLAGNCAWWMM